MTYWGWDLDRWVAEMYFSKYQWTRRKTARVFHYAMMGVYREDLSDQMEDVRIDH